jgi:hypothetical protein
LHRSIPFCRPFLPGNRSLPSRATPISVDRFDTNYHVKIEKPIPSPIPAAAQSNKNSQRFGELPGICGAFNERSCPPAILRHKPRNGSRGQISGCASAGARIGRGNRATPKMHVPYSALPLTAMRDCRADDADRCGKVQSVLAARTDIESAGAESPAFPARLSAPR